MTCRYPTIASALEAIPVDYDDPDFAAKQDAVLAVSAPHVVRYFAYCQDIFATIDRNKPSSDLALRLAVHAGCASAAQFRAKLEADWSQLNARRPT